MSVPKVQCIILIVLICPMYLLLGCESKDIVPFQNDDYFEYTKIDKGYVNLYQIESKEKGKFKITWRTGADSEPIELIVDKNGKIIETPTYPQGSLGYDLFYKRQIRLWLPTDKRIIGESVYFADFIDRNIVTEEKVWEKWNVWVTKHSNPFGWQENYFDKKTGFLVGSNAEGDVYIISDSSRELTK